MVAAAHGCQQCARVVGPPGVWHAPVHTGGVARRTAVVMYVHTLTVPLCGRALVRHLLVCCSAGCTLWHPTHRRHHNINVHLYIPNNTPRCSSSCMCAHWQNRWLKRPSHGGVLFTLHTCWPSGSHKTRPLRPPPLPPPPHLHQHLHLHLQRLRCAADAHCPGHCRWQSVPPPTRS